MGHRYGLRTLEKHGEEVHTKYCPQKPFIRGNISFIFKIEPLPTGTQRQSLATILRSWGWNAKPLQAVRASQGKAWEIGATSKPPSEVLQHDGGYLTVTLVKDLTKPTPTPPLVATSRTKQQIQKDATGASDTPWGSEGDPWSQWLKQNAEPTSAAPALKPGEAQTRISEVESRLKEDVQKTVKQQLEEINDTVAAAKIQKEAATEARLETLESHLTELQHQGLRFETYFQQAQAQSESQQQSILTLQAHAAQQQEVNATMQSTLQTCTEQLGKQQLGMQALASEVSTIQNGFEGKISDMFSMQMSRIEDLLLNSTEAVAKRARHDAWLVRHGSALGSCRVHERKVSPFSLGLKTVWLWFCLIWTLLFRLGEASVPGPCGMGSADLAFDRVQWSNESFDGNNTWIGVCNPSGVSNKHELFRSFPNGWWGCAETQATAQQLVGFRKAMKAQADPHRKFRVVSGAPAPCRAGSSTCGAWTGVLQFGTHPLRQVHFPMDDGIYESGRIVTSMGQFQQTCILHTTLYLPPKGPTYPRAKELCERLLEPVTKEIVLGRRGCRLITGDFNNPVGALEATKTWEQEGWKEIQWLFFERYGTPVRATCKDATSPDQIWLSPEMQMYVRDVGIIEAFPDHQILVGSFQFPGSAEIQRHWQLPARLPWEQVDSEMFQDECQKIPALDLKADSADALREWSLGVEQAVAKASNGDGQFPPGSFGRCSTLEPKNRPVLLPVPKSSRPGEVLILSSFLGRSVQLWFQQQRRFQHFRRKNIHASAATMAQGVQIWSSILKAKGFKGSFRNWWPTRSKRLQGSPLLLPATLPPLDLLEVIAADFAFNYKAYERWNHDRRIASIDAKWKAAHDKIFSVVKADVKEHIDTLVDEHCREITIVDHQRQLVRVQPPFPEGHVIGWQHQGLPAQVRRQEDLHEITSDLLLCDWQSLKCNILVYDTTAINERLENLWHQRWQKHQDVPIEHWHRVFQFTRTRLPRGNMILKPWTYEAWIDGLKHFKARAARGPDGWSREDLLHLPRCVVDQILQMFNALESGHPWPRQWSVALVHCIEKCSQASSGNMFRPITLFSMLYRLWAGVRATQILHFLAGFASEGQSGFIPECQASDIWWDIQTQLEVSAVSGEPLHGVVADLVKAYNLLPRLPVWHVLLHLGLPPPFVDCWSRFLGGLTRHFVVRGSCSPGLSSSTGYPEGCPLSCCAMVAIDILWHQYQSLYAHGCKSMSFVDNLEILADDPALLIKGLQVSHTFCSMLDLELDHAKLYGWSSNAEGRRWLHQNKLQVLHYARDLGGQMNYTKRKCIQTQMQRLQGVEQQLRKLRGSRLSTAQKRLCVTGAILPRGLHAIENVVIGDQHIDRLRAGIARALHWDRAGASSLVRIGLLNTAKLDPGFYQMWHSITLLRRQCRLHQQVRVRWRHYCIFYHEHRSHGPLGKITTELARLHWHLDPELQLTLHNGLKIDFVTFPQQGLHHFAVEAWQSHIVQRVHERPGFDDLYGFNGALLEVLDRDHNPQDLESLAMIRDGTFFTCEFIGKFNSRFDNTCSFCGEFDTRDHRFTQCPKYAVVHRRFANLITQWPSMPCSLRRHGLPSALPTEQAFLAEKQALFGQVPTWHIPCPTEGILHLFIDGSCRDSQDYGITTAAWSIVSASQQTCVSSGGLPGVLQTIPRAEIWALLQCLRWSSQFNGVLHVWSDSQLTVEGFRYIQTHDCLPADSDLADLWQLVETAFASSLAEVFIHKVAAHGALMQAKSPLEEWCIQWNNAADAAAVVANQNRPASFQRAYEAHRKAWLDQKQILREITQLHLAIAQIDFASPTATPDQTDEPAAVLQMLPWYVEATEECPIDWLHQIAHSSEFSFGTLSRVHQWLLDLEGSADFVCEVSCLEIYFAFSLDLGSPFSALLGSSQNPFVQLTVAADFSLFRKCLDLLFRRLEARPQYIQCTLAETGVVCGQIGLPFAWQYLTGLRVHEAIRSFVGSRPVTNHQGLSRPWRLC